MNILKWAAATAIVLAGIAAVGVVSVAEAPIPNEERLIAGINKAVREYQAKADRDIAMLNARIDRTNVVVGNHCSGTFISVEHSLILTNAHCIRGKDTETGETTVTIGIYRNHVRVGETTWTVDIIATDKGKDLALLQFRAGYTPHEHPARLLPRDGTIRRGERVYIVGNPGGLEATLVPGFVSSVTRNVTEMRGVPNRDVPRALIQVSGGIFLGNSGGALYNAQGELIGVPTLARNGAWHLGFAVPAEVIHEFLDEHCFGADREACLRKGDRLTVAGDS